MVAAFLFSTLSASSTSIIAAKTRFFADTGKKITKKQKSDYIISLSVHIIPVSYDSLINNKH